MQQSAGDDDLAAKIRSLVRHDALQTVFAFRFVCILNVDQLLSKTELYERILSLAMSALRQLFAADSIGKTRNVHDGFVGIQKLWLVTGLVFRFNDQSGQSAVGGGQRSRQAGGSGADDDDVPISEVTEVEVGLKSSYIEIRHKSSPTRGSRRPFD